MSKKLPTCKCGHDRHHYMVSPRNHYTWKAHIVLMLGVSAEPVKVTYECRQCGQVFDETTDKQVMAKQC